MPAKVGRRYTDYVVAEATTHKMERCGTRRDEEEKKQIPRCARDDTLGRQERAELAIEKSAPLKPEGCRTRTDSKGRAKARPTRKVSRG